MLCVRLPIVPAMDSTECTVCDTQCVLYILQHVHCMNTVCCLCNVAYILFYYHFAYIILIIVLKVCVYPVVCTVHVTYHVVCVTPIAYVHSWATSFTISTLTSLFYSSERTDFDI